MTQVIPFSTGMLDTGLFVVLNTETGMLYKNHNYIHNYCYQNLVTIEYPNDTRLSCSKNGNNGKYALQLKSDVEYTDFMQTTEFPMGERIIFNCILKQGENVLVTIHENVLIILNSYYGWHKPYKTIIKEDVVYWRAILETNKKVIY